MHLQELKKKSATDLLAFAEELEVENASAMRTQDMMFAILKQLADKNEEISGGGVVGNPAGRIWFLALTGSELSAGS